MRGQPDALLIGDSHGQTLQAERFGHDGIGAIRADHGIGFDGVRLVAFVFVGGFDAAWPELDVLQLTFD